MFNGFRVNLFVTFNYDYFIDVYKVVVPLTVSYLLIDLV